LPPFGWRQNDSASTIERICAFDTKFYKNAGTILAVSSCLAGNKKIFQISDFCSALPSFLVGKNVYYTAFFIDEHDISHHFSVKHGFSRDCPSNGILATALEQTKILCHRISGRLSWMRYYVPMERCLRAGAVAFSYFGGQHYV
jgi:hypothetical protein